MKKLFAFLLGLNASLGALAYNNPSGFSGVSFQDIGSDTQFIEMTTAGSLSTWAQNETELGYMGQTSRTKLVITGPMSASDFTALSGSAWDSFTTVDLSKVTVTDPTYISNMTLANAQTIILPNGLTKAQIESLKTEASGVVAGMTGSSETTDVTTFTYTLPGSSDPIIYTGEVSGDDDNGYTGSVSTTIRRDLSNADGYPQHSFINKMNDDILVPLADAQVNNGDGTYKTSWKPAEFEITLTQHDTPTIKYYMQYDEVNGYQVEVLESWGWAINGFYSPDYSTTTTTLSQNIVIDGNSYSSGTLVYKDIKHNYTYNYKPFIYNNGSNSYFGNEVSYTGSTTPYQKEGSDTWYGIINNDNTIEFPISSSFSYTYYNLTGELVTIAPSSTPHATGYVDLEYTNNSQPLTKNVTSETSFIVDGMAAYVNTAGSLSTVASTIYDSSVLTQYRGAKNITIMGNIDDDDLTELSETNFASEEYLSMKDAVLDGDITTISSKATAATVLPKIKDGESSRSVTTTELGAIQGRTDKTYQCVGFFDSEDADKLYLYAYNDLVANIAPAVTTSTKIEMQPNYSKEAGTDAYWAGGWGMAQSFNDAFANIPAVSIDFGMMHVALSCDFSNLNSNTKHICVPMNGSGYDITNKANKSGFDGYIYPTTLDVVTTYVAQGIQITCNGKTYSTGVTENTSFTYLLKSNREDLSEYYDARQKAAVRQVFISASGVAYTQENIDGFANLTNEKLDFIDAVVANEVIASLDNDYVKYIALPTSAVGTINGTATSCDYSDKNTSLLCIGALDGTVFTSWSRPNDETEGINITIEDGGTQQVPSVKKVTDMIGNVSTYTAVNMSGYLALDDIQVGKEGVPGGGLIGNSIIATADFSKAVFMPNEDMSFEAANWQGTVLTSLKLPTSSNQTLMPDNCLHGFANLDELCIPYNIEHIGVSAFEGMGGRHITTTDANGNVVDNGYNTITFSANLKSIGTQAFWTAGNKSLTDVYVLATTAPKCAANAFNSENYCGNIGFGGNFQHPITRTNYKNGNDIWYAILHFPSDVTEAEAKKYTDIDREYSLVDETSAFNAKGELKHWPNHNEISRAYNQALAGATWNEWPYLNETGYNTTIGRWPDVLTAKGYTEEEAAAIVQEYIDLGYDGSKYILRYTDGGNVDGIATEPDGTMPADYYTGIQDGVTPETCDFYDYIGWHQFVLTDYYRTTEIVVNNDPKNYTTLDYYTLCFPYDLTRQEVIDLIGAPCKNSNTLDGTTLTEDAFPEVYTLKSVTRNTSTQQITLGFSKELMAIAKTGKDITITIDPNDDVDEKGWNYNAPLKTKNGENVFIKGGYPYLIKPIVPANTTFSNLAEYMMSISNLTVADLGYKEQAGENGGYISVPYRNQGVISRDENNNQLTWTDGDGNEWDYYYYFQGTYVNEDLPIYAYYLGQKNGKRSFFYNNSGTRKWNRFSAIIGGKCNTGSIAYIGFDHGEDMKSASTVSILMRNADDSFNPATNDVKVNFTFEGEDGFDEAVAIESINGESVAPMEGDVYNVTGQFVGKSIDGLSKGLYIINGKKVMVK